MNVFKNYTITIDSKNHKKIIKNCFGYLGGKDKEGNTINLNNVYYEKNSKPWFPLMGEFHFSRCDHKFWKDFLLKMKTCGLTIVATNIFWIFHEENEGEWNWKKDNDLKAFTRLCCDLGLYVFLRVGPWGHGEVRNGGFPYWLIKKCNRVRENNPEYLKYVAIFYREIYEQIKGQFFKDNGPVIGVQIENEYGHCGGAEGSIDHLLTLKKLILDIGYDVPLYTITGWGGAKIPDEELLPVLSNYSTHPWAESTFKLPLFVEFLFRKASGDVINYTSPTAHRLIKSAFDPEKYPFTMCEMGGGICLTYSRRPLLKPKDVSSNIFVQLGSGAVFLGYYMFSGGINPKGKNGYLNESKEAGEWTTVPKLSYDFQAPVRMYGQISDSYRYIKILHYFINDYSETLATMQTTFPDIFPDTPYDTKTLRYAVRSCDYSGFVFFNNYQREYKMEDINADLTVNINKKAINFGKFTLKKDSYFFWPFNLELDDIVLIFAKAQPLCILNNNDIKTYIFLKCIDILPVFYFKKDSIVTIEAKYGKFVINKSEIIYQCNQDTDDLIQIKSKTDKSIEILLLKNEHELKVWKFNDLTEQRLIITDSDLVFENNRIISTDRKAEQNFLIYPNKDINFFYNNKMLAHEKKLFYSRIKIHKDKINKIKFDQKKNKNGKDKNSWSIKFQKDLFNNMYYANEIYLRLHLECNTAEVYIDEKLIIDYFFNGEVLEVGLKRYREVLEKKREIVVELIPLTKEDDICFDIKPHFINGIACRIKKVEIEPEYMVEIISK